MVYSLNKEKKVKLFNKDKIHLGQRVYLVSSIFYLILLSSSFMIMLYGPSDIKDIAVMLLFIVSIISFISQIINIVCNALNICNVRREKIIKGKSKYELGDKHQLIIATGFTGESVAFLGIASVLFILGLHMMPFSDVALPLRCFSLLASLFSITYGYVLLKKSIKDYNESGKGSMHSKWVVFNGTVFVLLAVYNILYETLLYELLDFYNDHYLSVLLKSFVFIGYASVLTSIFLSQILVPHNHEMQKESSEEEQLLKPTDQLSGLTNSLVNAKDDVLTVE